MSEEMVAVFLGRTVRFVGRLFFSLNEASDVDREKSDGPLSSDAK